MRNTRFLGTLEATAVLLFLLQSVRVLFSVLFGLIYDAIFAEILPLTVVVGILAIVIVACLTPLATPRRPGRPIMLAAALITAAARVPVTLNLPWVRLWSSIIVLGAGAFYVATLIRNHPGRFGAAMIAGLAADQFLRTAGNTFDVSLRSWWWPVQVALVAEMAFVGWRQLAFDTSDETEVNETSQGMNVGAGLALGAILFLQTSLIDLPNAVARWSGIPYEVVAPLLMAVTLLPLVGSVRRRASRILRGPLGSLALISLTLAGLAAGRAVGGVLGLLGLLLAQFLVLLVCFGLTGTQRRERTGLGLGLGLVLFVLINFAYAFTFTYPYTIPAFRNMGLAVILLSALVASLPSLRATLPEGAWPELRPTVWLAAVLLSAIFAVPCPAAERAGPPLRVATYNIHYGYNTTWQLNLEEMARTIEESEADIVMMQEVDTGRITSYGVDTSLWLARRLGMTDVYQPTLEKLSGIALLSRYPIVSSDGAFLQSSLEQTGVVHALLQVGEENVHAYGIWLGLEPEERARQLSHALDYIADASPVVLGGDFNSDPNSPIYASILDAGFIDPFVILGVDLAPTSPAIEPRGRIDFVWGRGLLPTAAAVPDSLASDHRMVITEWTLP